MVKIAANAGEMAPFPYIKGLCGCVVLILEAIEVHDNLLCYVVPYLIRDFRELARMTRIYKIWWRA